MIELSGVWMSIVCITLVNNSRNTCLAADDVACHHIQQFENTNQGQIVWNLNRSIQHAESTMASVLGYSLNNSTINTGQPNVAPNGLTIGTHD